MRCFVGVLYTSRVPWDVAKKIRSPRREKQAAGPTVEEDLAPLLSAALTMGKVCCDAFVVEPKSKRARGEEERKANKTNVSERASKHRSQ